MTRPGPFTAGRAAHQALELLVLYGLIDRFTMDRRTGQVWLVEGGRRRSFSAEQVADLAGQAIADLVEAMVRDPKGEEFTVGRVPFVENIDVRGEVYRRYWTSPFPHSALPCRSHP